jgi:hypothetical protein
MGEYAGPRDLRNLLSVAAKLSLLASDTQCLDDRSLYLMAAEALEERASWLANTLPDETRQPCFEKQLHQPIDMIV